MKNTLLNSTINEYIFPMIVLKTFDFFYNTDYGDD